MDRLTSETYLDGTSRTYTWDKLDLVAVTDRQGRTTSYSYDAVRNLVAVTDPLGNMTQLGYYENQTLKSLTDPTAILQPGVSTSRAGSLRSIIPTARRWRTPTRRRRAV